MHIVRKVWLRTLVFSSLDSQFAILDSRSSFADSRLLMLDPWFSIVDPRVSSLNSRSSLDSRSSIPDSCFSILDSPSSMQEWFSILDSRFCPLSVPRVQQRPRQRFRQGFLNKVSARNCRLELLARKSSGCLHIDSGKVVARFQQSLGQVSNITTRHSKKSKTQCETKSEINIRIGSSKMFQPEVPATGFQQGFQPGFTTFQQRFTSSQQSPCNECSHDFHPAGFQLGSEKIPVVFWFSGACIFPALLGTQLNCCWVVALLGIGKHSIKVQRIFIFKCAPCPPQITCISEVPGRFQEGSNTQIEHKSNKVREGFSKVPAQVERSSNKVPGRFQKVPSAKVPGRLQHGFNTKVPTNLRLNSVDGRNIQALSIRYNLLAPKVQC